VSHLLALSLIDGLAFFNFRKERIVKYASRLPGSEMPDSHGEAQQEESKNNENGFLFVGCEFTPGPE